MLTITNDAMKMCHATIVQLSGAQSESKCLRLERKADSGLAVTFDNPRKSDELIEHEGRIVFAVPENFLAFCAGKTLSVDDVGNLVLS